MIIGPDVDKRKFSSLIIILQANDFEPVVGKDGYYVLCFSSSRYGFVYGFKQNRRISGLSNDLGDDKR